VQGVEYAEDGRDDGVSDGQEEDEVDEAVAVVDVEVDD
jgi:hypothetical protein